MNSTSTNDQQGGGGSSNGAVGNNGPSSSSNGGVGIHSELGNLPKDGHVIVAILKDLGISDYEPRVLHQILEFSYRYCAEVLEDSKLLANHAKKKQIDIEDVKLAVQMMTEQNFTTPPSRDILLETARAKNSTALPVPKASSGAMKLPPDRHCLTACNYRLKFKAKNSRGGGGNKYSPYSYQAQPPKMVVTPSAPISHYGAKPTMTTQNNLIKINPQFKIAASGVGGAQIQIQMPTNLINSSAATGVNNKRKRDDE